MSIASDPYRLFFPLGWLAAVAGVARLLPAAGGSMPAGLRFHSIAMIEGFVSLYAFGFLFTFVPRRTKTAPPAAWELAAAAAGPLVAVAAAALDRFALAHAAWLAAAAVVVRYAASRLLAMTAPRVPGAFAWVPVGLLAGAAGAALTTVALHLGVDRGPRLWALGRALLLQGAVPGLAVGVGAILLPQLTRGVAAPPEYAPRALRRSRLLHLAAAALFLASFPLEVYRDSRAGLALRAAVALAVLLPTARIDLPPSVPGLHRRVLWASAWLLPAGWALAALVPRLRGPALHVGFVGGYAAMTLAVSLHVVLSHGGRPEQLGGSPPAVVAMAALLWAALAARLLVGLDPDRAPAWLSVAAGLLLLALGAWLAAVGRALRPARPPG